MTGGGAKDMFDNAYTQKERGYRHCPLCGQVFRHNFKHKCRYLKEVKRY